MTHPPPLTLFRKFIQFGAATLPSVSQLLTRPDNYQTQVRWKHKRKPWEIQKKRRRIVECLEIWSKAGCGGVRYNLAAQKLHQRDGRLAKKERLGGLLETWDKDRNTITNTNTKAKTTNKTNTKQKTNTKTQQQRNRQITSIWQQHSWQRKKGKAKIISLKCLF